MAKTKDYEVKLLPSNESGAKATMYRGGVAHTVGEPQVLALTKEEAEVYENDKRFQLSTPSDATSESVSSDETSGSESDAQDGDESSEEDVTSEDSDSEDSSSDEAEEVSDESTDEEASEEDVEEAEVTVDSLLKNNSRDELNALAVEAGVEAPESLKDKTEVAQAIVDAKARNSESEDTTTENEE